MLNSQMWLMATVVDSRYRLVGVGVRHLEIRERGDERGRQGPMMEGLVG